LFTYINQLFAYANRTQDQETADLPAPTRFFITFFFSLDACIILNLFSFVLQLRAHQFVLLSPVS
jgi:hypothetical protein